MFVFPIFIHLIDLYYSSAKIIFDTTFNSITWRKRDYLFIKLMLLLINYALMRHSIFGCFLCQQADMYYFLFYKVSTYIYKDKQLEIDTNNFSFCKYNPFNA